MNVWCIAERLLWVSSIQSLVYRPRGGERREAVVGSNNRSVLLVNIPNYFEPVLPSGNRLTANQLSKVDLGENVTASISQR